ncbi:MAG TPA: phosphohistidine phosphatase SixA [Chlorobaculum sp.]|uniref:Phosphohistidine phosphatase SixA n=1 Tax=Chlorobaculum tepidum (strain ATCC 49652 / DSM 12025 / NBRC 103806 / TLS) TaxID=194439 RepID=Q8KG77_CHLTE|nr:phosphohistidine phosphatase SixA [Chlorobaculum tepidum]AAM71339.1 phosphohistidine phosphatase SixA [Chlorobaculum tepidum TLS]HBU24349.1 phosphohistidine phosphatase SixA [Chlorobaculum sp.]
MKTLYLVRHAKAGWKDPAQSDFDRSLTKQGRRQAEEMSERLRKKGITPERLISSPAHRALETAEIFADTLGIERREIVQKIEIYEGGIDALAVIVRSLADEDNTVMLFGHNPMISHFVQWLTAKPAEAMNTCGIAKIELDCDHWRDTAEGSGKLVWYKFPERE